MEEDDVDIESPDRNQLLTLQTQIVVSICVERRAYVGISSEEANGKLSPPMDMGNTWLYIVMFPRADKPMVFSMLLDKRK